MVAGLALGAVKLVAVVAECEGYDGSDGGLGCRWRRRSSGELEKRSSSWGAARRGEAMSGLKTNDLDPIMISVSSPGLVNN